MTRAGGVGAKGLKNQIFLDNGYERIYVGMMSNGYGAEEFGLIRSNHASSYYREIEKTKIFKPTFFSCLYVALQKFRQNHYFRFDAKTCVLKNFLNERSLPIREG